MSWILTTIPSPKPICPKYGSIAQDVSGPTRGVGFGLAWVPHAMAKDGTRIAIQSGRNEWPATVITEPIYDPEGARLRA